MKTIVVPISISAQKLLDYDEETPNDIIEEVLTQNEFDTLWRLGVIYRINAKCNTLIDEYEDEHICDIKILNRLIDLFEHGVQRQDFAEADVSKILQQAKLAARLKTGIYFYF